MPSYPITFVEFLFYLEKVLINRFHGFFRGVSRQFSSVGQKKYTRKLKIQFFLKRLLIGIESDQSFGGSKSRTTFWVLTKLSSFVPGNTRKLSHLWNVWKLVTCDNFTKTFFKICNWLDSASNQLSRVRSNQNQI